MYVEINQNTVETPLKDTAWGWAHPSLWHFCNRKSFDNADGQLRVKSTASQNFNDVVVEFTFCLALYPDFSVILHTVFSWSFQPCFWSYSAQNTRKSRMQLTMPSESRWPNHWKWCIIANLRYQLWNSISCAQYIAFHRVPRNESLS